MSEHRVNEYKSLEVSALAKEGMAFEARRQAQGLLQLAEKYEGEALALREEMGRIAELLVENSDQQDA